MKCEIIRDLLPSYIDGLTSAESNAFIEEHLNGCAECQEILKEMKADISTEKTKEETDIRPFLKIKKDTIRKIAIAVIVTVMVCVLGIELYEQWYYGGKSIRSDQAKISIEEEHGIKSLHFMPVEENKIFDIGYTDNEEINGKMPLFTLCIVERNQAAYLEKPTMNEYPYYFVDEDTVVDLFSVPNEQQYDGDDFIAIKFNDGVKTIRLADIRDNNISGLK